MPTYEYQCDACEHKFERFQSILAGRVRKCPKCGKLKARRLISRGGGIIFKGSGFYATDYRSESYKQGAKKDSPAAASSSSGDGPAKGGSPAKGEAAKSAGKSSTAKTGKAAG